MRRDLDSNSGEGERMWEGVWGVDDGKKCKQTAGRMVFLVVN